MMRKEVPKLNSFVVIECVGPVGRASREGLGGALGRRPCDIRGKSPANLNGFPFHISGNFETFQKRQEKASELEMSLDSASA